MKNLKKIKSKNEQKTKSENEKMMERIFSDMSNDLWEGIPEDLSRQSNDW